MYVNPLDFSKFTKEKGWSLESLQNIPTAKRLGEAGFKPEQPDSGQIPGPWHSLPTVRHTGSL